ncbi:ribosomal L7Ae/L30e/S12e/Gadd45 family protein [Paenibacillaceae bacterium T2]|uniref:Ribosomal L7Ae/L30e/S12e/Gadd45 family protein n=2 Tax=Ferviditalea candida TaxID=3108399 RepID=A0ABU5ZF37_9BACL|nr:ribosomal L7Ae/L30e/S12e/Gadd45 family protein [Paenibacillaceae bacterium T2]
MKPKTGWMMKDKLLSYLGLCLKAGKLATGDEGALKAVRSGQARLVLLAEDASENAKKKYRDKCGFYRIPLVEVLSRAELGSSLGKKDRVVVAVLDTGFADLILKSLNRSSEVDKID